MGQIIRGLVPAPGPGRSTVPSRHGVPVPVVLDAGLVDLSHGVAYYGGTIGCKSERPCTESTISANVWIGPKGCFSQQISIERHSTWSTICLVGNDPIQWYPEPVVDVYRGHSRLAGCLRRTTIRSHPDRNFHLPRQ